MAHNTKETMLNIVQFDLEEKVTELDLPEIHPREYYLREKSKFKKKRRCIDPSRMPEIRLMRHDVRRRFGEMFINATNFRDVPLMTKYFQEYSRPDCAVIRVLPPSSEVNKNIDLVVFDGKYTRLSGIQEYLDAFGLSIRMMPDQIVRVHQSQVRLKQGSQGSVVVLKSLVYGTKVLTVHTEDTFIETELLLGKEEDNRSVDNTPFSESSDEASSFPSNDITPSLNSPPSAPIKVKSKYYLDIAPVAIETVGAVLFVLVFDENHYIKQLHIEYKVISETPVSHID